MSSTAPPFKVCIEPAHQRFATDGLESIMQAAKRAGVDLPRSCQNGTCRTCKCQLLSGSVGYLIAWPGLSKEEKAQGVILPCVAYAESDVVIELPPA